MVVVPSTSRLSVGLRGLSWSEKSRLSVGLRGLSWAETKHSRKAGTPRGRPSRGTAGSIPRTGGHQPKDWQALFFNYVGYREFFLVFSEYVSEVARCSGTSVWGAVCRSCFSVAIPFTFLFTRSPSDVVPVAILPSSFSFYPDRAEHLPKVSHSVWCACIPGCQRCHLRLNGALKTFSDR